jgi:octaprenyl-diphosphate synthase
MQSYRKVIQEELEVFEQKFREAVKSPNPLLDRIMRYIVRRKGKQIRPMFVFLSARLCGPANESTYRAASLVELLHTATLVHDDVVDDAMERRNMFSINALWKNKIAVLVGDYLLSKGLLLSLNNDEYHLLQILSTAIQQMSEGELMQMEKARGLNLSETVYFEIIRNKTASLVAASCAAGAWSTSRDDAAAEKMRLFGEKVGMAFQIKDDLFDYGRENVGKPTGNDIREKKLTLPLIFTLNRAPSAQKRELIYIIKNENRDRQRVSQVIDAVQTAGGIDYAAAKMLEYRDEALQILRTFPPSDVAAALEELVIFSTDRKY